jgi:hypothetical protein
MSKIAAFPRSLDHNDWRDCEFLWPKNQTSLKKI